MKYTAAYKYHPKIKGALGQAKRCAKHDISMALIEHLLENLGPHVVSLHEETNPSLDWIDVRGEYKLVVTLEPTETRLYFANLPTTKERRWSDLRIFTKDLPQFLRRHWQAWVARYAQTRKNR